MVEQKQVFNIEVPIPFNMVLINRSKYLDLIQKEEVWPDLYILKAKQIKAKVSFVSIVVRERRKM